jgi:hypothetical protein
MLWQDDTLYILAELNFLIVWHTFDVGIHFQHKNQNHIHCFKRLDPLQELKHTVTYIFQVHYMLTYYIVFRMDSWQTSGKLEGISFFQFQFFWFVKHP